MNFVRHYIRSFAQLFRRRRADAEMTEEMRFHLEQRTAENLSDGLPAEEAQFAAQKRFGNLASLQEQARAQRAWFWLDHLNRDLRFALRMLARTPGFTATALATLALCLGANFTIFAAVDSILLRPLGYPQPDRLVTIYSVYPKLAGLPNGASITTYYERRDQIPAFASLASISEATSVVGEIGATTIESLGRVTPEFFSTLGVEPFMGRTVRDGEMTYQTDQVAVISYEFWRSHFNGSPEVLGKTIRMDGISRVIVGVLPAHFRFLSFQAPIYSPLSSEEAERAVGARHNNNTIQIARLASGATLADAQAQLDAHDQAHAAEFSQAQIVAESGWHSVIAPLHADHVAAVRPLLLLLQAGAFLLLVIGGVNLVNLLLIRASSRAREFAIRQALGATRGHVIREALTETLVLTLLGTLLGLGVGAVGIKLLGYLGAAQLPLGAQIAWNGKLVEVALIGALITGIALSLPVIWFSLNRRPAAALQSESRGSTANRSTQRLRHGFIVAQIALAFVLLTAAGLLGMSLRRAMAVSPGFRVDHVITGQFSLTWNNYHDFDAFRPFFGRLLEMSAHQPGVLSIGAITNVPLSGAKDADSITIPDYVLKAGEAALVHNRFGVAGDYFSAMGIPLQAGRFLNEDDATRRELTCVVDENFARHYWPAGGAVGKQIYRGSSIEPNEKPFTVVGVVGAVKQTGLTEQRSNGSIYYPYNRVWVRNYFLVARTSLPPDSLAASLRKIVRAVDPDIPLTDLRSMELRISDSLAPRRSPAILSGIFGATALLLAIIGLYGVMAYSVAQRSSEFGIRMALGAQGEDMLRLVFGQGMAIAGIGLATGLAIALLLTGYLSSLLFEVRAHDPLTLAGIGAILTAVAAFACFLPARRAMKIDPVIALRGE